MNFALVFAACFFSSEFPSIPGGSDIEEVFFQLVPEHAQIYYCGPGKIRPEIRAKLSYTRRVSNGA